MPIDPWYEENIVCPVDRIPLKFDGQHLISSQGRRYPVVDGLPVLLLDDAKQTIKVAQTSIERAMRRNGDGPDQFYLETLGIKEQDNAELLQLWKAGLTRIDPVVIMVIGATCGNAYNHLVGRGSLTQYPIPSIGLAPSSPGDTLLDIGCNWGRWSVAAARKGFSVVGIDPSLGAIMAARRVAKELKLDIKYVVADARFLPFREGKFDCVHSYSVFQHFSVDDARSALFEVNRVLKPGGSAKIQMANKWGLRSVQQQARRRFREAKDFEVRYWTLAEIRSAFSQIIGKAQISADCYFGLGWQWGDLRLMNQRHKPILILSEALRRISVVVSPMRAIADSVFCTAVKNKTEFGDEM
jgi:2-polyprenyl-3-methyl-5-hydroxy-6-metoxy-1,4-benzoquinol methylase/uncharacterized protein YbaR (Trm112 family)